MVYHFIRERTLRRGCGNFGSKLVYIRFLHKLLDTCVSFNTVANYTYFKELKELSYIRTPEQN